MAPAKERQEYSLQAVRRSETSVGSELSIKFSDVSVFLEPSSTSNSINSIIFSKHPYLDQSKRDFG